MRTNAANEEDFERDGAMEGGMETLETEIQHYPKTEAHSNLIFVEPQASVPVTSINDKSAAARAVTGETQRYHSAQATPPLTPPPPDFVRVPQPL